MAQLTNAQAALQAAATIYTGSRGNVSVETVTGMASMFKRSLDKADRDDEQRWVREQAPAVDTKPVPRPPYGPGSARPKPVEQCPVWQCTQPKGHEGDEHPDKVEK